MAPSSLVAPLVRSSIVLPPQSEQALGRARTSVAAVAKADAASALQPSRVLAQLTMRRGDDVAVLDVRDREVAIHIFDLVYGEVDLLEDLFVVSSLDVTRPHEDAHREHPRQRASNGRRLPRRQHVGQVLDRNLETVQIG